MDISTYQKESNLEVPNIPHKEILEICQKAQFPDKLDEIYVRGNIRELCRIHEICRNFPVAKLYHLYCICCDLLLVHKV